METNGEQASSTCVVCKKPGAPWCCQRKGCNRRYHFPCVKKHQPDEFITVGGGWNCENCIKEKVQRGAAFEVESIWDVINGDNETKYMVKYKNLAHAQNCWIPESELCQEAPELVAKFNQARQKDKRTTWKKEWTEVERLLMRRNLMYVETARKFFQGLANKIPYCNIEWLVKWRGLGYEHATWELGTRPFLQSTEAKRLKHEYNSRHNDAARRAKLASEHNKIKQDPFLKLETLPSDFPHGLDDGYLDSLNRLRQFWHKSHNAVLINHEERVIRTILFIKSVVNHIAQPFLILSMEESLSLWEEKIRQLIPSVNTVVHTNRFISSFVEVTEFWGRDGVLLFQVLLSNPDAIQDFKAIKLINWECVIVDQCDDVRMSRHLEQFKTLSADFKLIIVNTQLKDDPSEYMNLVSFLEPGDVDAVPDISILKEKFSSFIVYPTETDSSDCDTVPLAGEKEGAFSQVLAGGIMQKRRAFLEKPRNTNILESSFKEHGVTLSMQVSNLSASSIEPDVPASRDFSIAKVTNQIIDAKGSNRTVLWKGEIRTINVLLTPRLSRLCETLGIPENVNSVANMFFDHIMKSHKAMLTPFIIPRSYLQPLTVASRFQSSSLNELCEYFLQWLEIAERIFSPHFVPRRGYCSSISAVSANTHQEQVVLQENKSLTHKIERICARRENELHALQKVELLDLKWHCYWRAHESVFKHMCTIVKSDKNSTTLLEKTLLKFKAFQEHMVCQRRRLENLQEKARALEKLRKEEWVEMVKSGELEESFDFSRIPLPSSGFVVEKFDWVCGERAMDTSSASRSNPAILNSTTQQEIEASPSEYTGDRIPQQLDTSATSFMAEVTPVNLEELPDCDDMLIEPIERETDTGSTSTSASMPDIGVSVLIGSDVLSEANSNFLEMPSFTQEMFPNGLNTDPIVNELTRINHRRRNLANKHEEKKLRLRLQLEGNVENIKRKYDEFFKEEDATLRKQQKVLGGVAHAMGMPPSTSWAPPVQNTGAPIAPNFSTVQVSPCHVQSTGLAPTLRTSILRSLSTCRVPPVRPSMPHTLSNMGAPTMSPLQPPSIPSIPLQPVSTNRAPPGWTGSQRASTSQYILRCPAPSIGHRWSQMSIRSRAPQAPRSHFSYNVHNFGGSRSDPAWRSG